jgi:uncharacterized membrane protein
MEIETTTVVNRPVAEVWDFFAVHHVENHPRWDPDIKLEKISDGPIGVGTVIKRWITRYETPTEGTMEVVEFEPERVMVTKIQDGPIETNGRVTFVPQSKNRTQLTVWAQWPEMDDLMADKIRPLMQRSGKNIKDLIESET